MVPKLLCTSMQSFPQPGPCNAPAVKPQLHAHGRCSWSQGCPEGLKLAMMGGCGMWRLGESLSLRKRGQDVLVELFWGRKFHPWSPRSP